MEVKQQVDNAPTVTATKLGKTEKEKHKTETSKDTSAENVTTDSANRQSYQQTPVIMVFVKYA